MAEAVAADPRGTVEDDRVVSNSVYLMAATVGTAGLSFLFWVVAAHLFSPDQVGRAASLTNAVSLIAYLSLCGLNSTLIRFPAAAEGRQAQITQAMLVVCAASCLLGTTYLLGLPAYGASLVAVRDDPLRATLIVLFCVLATLNLLTDAVFVSERIPQYNTLIDGVMQGVTKLGLPFALTGLGAFGLVAATGGGYALAVLASLYFLHRRIGFRFRLKGDGTRLREQAAFSAATYASSLLNLAPLLVLPMIVLQRLGAASAAFYFMAFQIANLANALSFAISESMFAEVSVHASRFGPVLRHSARLIALVQLPAAVLLAVGSGLVLRLFGSAYADQAQGLLVVLALGAVAVALNTWASFAIKLANRMTALIWSNVVYVAVTVGLAAAWAGHGLVWFGWAWFLGNLTSGLVALATLARIGRDRRISRIRRPARPARARGPANAPMLAPSTLRTVLVVNAYVRENAGDAALLAVCLRHVRTAFPGATVSIAGMEDPHVRPDFDGATNLGSIRRYVADGAIGTPHRILRKVTGAPVGFLGLLLPRAALRPLLRLLPAEVRQEASAVTEADLVVSMGGGYFNARPGPDGYQNLFYVSLPLLLARHLSIPVVLAPQSFGPFASHLQRRLAAHVVRRVQMALAREDLSVEALAGCGVHGAPVRRAVDAGFAFAPQPQVDWHARLGVPAQVPLVAVTARQWLAPRAQERYERALAATVDALRADGSAVVLVPQVTSGYLTDDDRIVERRIAGFCSTPPLSVDERVDFRDLKDLYGQCSIVLGTRFHSVIFALTSGVPCIAIEYEHKTRGIMRDLGLEPWVVPIAEVSAARLASLLDRLRRERQGYLRTLSEYLPTYVSRAEELPALLRAALDDAERGGAA